MKILELSAEAEKLLAQVVDAALKAGGLQMHHMVVELFKHIKESSSVEVVSEVQE